MKIQVLTNGKWSYVLSTQGSLMTTPNAFEALKGDQDTLNRLCDQFYGKDFRMVR